ncbi:MAG: DUF4350 domain-containing protein [Candidatus Kariarchaeaceae archaeon]
MSIDNGSQIRWAIFKAIWWWIAIISLLTVSFLVPVSITPSYSSLNEGWNGMSEFYNYLEEEDYQVKRLFTDFGDYIEDAQNSLIFITGSQRDYSAIDTRKIREFVSEGGSVFILDDYGSASKIYEEFGVYVEEGTILEMNPDNYYKSPKCPITFSLFRNNKYELLLNEAGSLSTDFLYFLNYELSELKTSQNSFLDANDDGNYDPLRENYGRQSFFKLLQNGRGKIAILSDASMVINEVFKEQFLVYDNIPFVTDVIDYMLAAKSNPSIIFDETHRFWVPLGTTGVIGFISSLIGFVEANPITALVFSSILLAVIYLSYSRKTPWQILKRRRYDAAVEAIKLKSRISEHGPSYSPTMTLEEIILADIGGMINVYGLNSFLHIYTQERIAQIINNKPQLATEVAEFQGIKLKTYEYYEVINYIEYLLKK